MSDFDRDYFIQTRREIDSEKAERNRLLHLAILVLGGAYAALINATLTKLEKLDQFALSEFIGVLVCFWVPLLIFITGIIKARIIRKDQIADRWDTLHNLLGQNPDLLSLSLERSLEARVVGGLRGKRYLMEDKVVLCALSALTYFPFFGALVWRGIKGDTAFPVLLGFVVIVLHMTLSWRWLFSHQLLPAAPSQPTVENACKPAQKLP